VDHTRQSTCHTIQGIQKLHSIFNFLSFLATNCIGALACYYDYCLVGLDSECVWKLHLSPLQIMTMHPNMEDHLQNLVTQNDQHFMVDYDDFTNLVDIYDVFIVVVGEDNAKGMEYVTMKLRKVKASRQCYRQLWDI